MEEGQVYHTEQSPHVYDEAFPALPESNNQTPVNDLGKWNDKMRVGSSVITQLFRVPPDERRYDHNNSFGEKESMRTCSLIMKETGAHIETATGKDMALTFLITGKQNSVMEARRKILGLFQTQASAKLPIPKEHHGNILGKAGSKLKDIEKRTATRINIPSIADPSEEITVTGTREGIEKAFHELQVISDEQSKKTFKRISVLKVYHPFIAGAHNENIDDIMAVTGTRIHIPPASAQVNEISIVGEKEGVAAAHDRIQSMLTTIEKYTIVGVEVPKMQHKYVIGPKGSGIAEILQMTGVSVEMPPLDSQKETITLRGPQDKLGSALNMVYEKANSVQAVTVDAPSWIHKYIIGRKGANIKQITQDMSKVHVQFTEKEDKITIEGLPEEVEQAKAKLKELTAEMVNKLTYTTLVVDPKYYKHIIGKQGANVNRLKELTGVVINISDSDQNTIRIEGDKQGVATAKQELEEMIAKMELEKEKDVVIDCKYHKLLIGQKGEAIRETKEKFSQVSIIFPPQAEKSNIVKLRGPKDEVDKCHKHLMKKVKDIMDNNSYSVDIPAHQCHKYIIGKGGAAIKKLREETNTTIEMSSGSNKSDIITITGKKENVERAKEIIIKIQSEQEGIVTDEVSIPPKMYNLLIGAGGKIIKSITEGCGGVQIKFPSVESTSDKVVLRGSEEDVKKAKQLLQEQVLERELQSYTAEVRANPQHHKYLIGRSGTNINRIRESTGTRIIFPSDKDYDKTLITIIGKREGVELAKAELLAAIEKMDNVQESVITVDQRHHKYFVARRCEMLHQIEYEFSGVTISFPRSGVDSNEVTIKGPPNLIEPVKQKISEIIRDLEERVTITCDIPQKHHRSVMGVKGAKVQEIENRFDVKIKFPDRNRTDDQFHPDNENGDVPLVNGDSIEPNVHDLIHITGKPQNCELAKQALKDNEPIEYEMEVPSDYHRGIIGQKGQNVKNMMNLYDVYIEVPGHNSQQEFIRLSGAPAAVENAKQGILEEMKKLDDEREDRKLKSFQLTLDVDPEFHPKIIGKRGSVISKIRDKHGVQIMFPRRGEADENIITIQGYEDKALAAKADILAIVNELNELSKEEFEIDSRVHSRLIGSRGWSIRKIMDNYKVEIRFPKTGSSNPNLVTIYGQEDDVFNAKDHLLNLEEEYLQELDEIESREAMRSSASGGWQVGAASGGGNSSGGSSSNNGFVVKGAPWDQNKSQSAPDTASTQEFPSFGAPVSSGPPAPSWGPRR